MLITVHHTPNGGGVVKACMFLSSCMISHEGCVPFSSEKVWFVVVRIDTAPGAASARWNHWAVTSHAGTEVQLWQDDLSQVCKLISTATLDVTQLFSDDFYYAAYSRWRSTKSYLLQLVIAWSSVEFDTHTHTHPFNGPFSGTTPWSSVEFETHTHPFNGPFSGTTRVRQYQKGKTNLDFTEARDSEWQWHQLGHMQVCTSLQTDDHASTPPLSFLTGRMPFLPPNQQCQSTEGTVWDLPINFIGWIQWQLTLCTRCSELTQQCIIVW